MVVREQIYEAKKIHFLTVRFKLTVNEIKAFVGVETKNNNVDAKCLDR